YTLVVPKWYGIKTPSNPANSFRWVGPGGAPAPTLTSIQNDIPRTGEVTYRFTWPEGTIMPETINSWIMEGDLTLSPTAPAIELRDENAIRFYASSATTPAAGCGGFANWWPDAGPPDYWDLNGNGNTNEFLCVRGLNVTP